MSPEDRLNRALRWAQRRLESVDRTAEECAGQAISDPTVMTGVRARQSELENFLGVLGQHGEDATPAPPAVATPGELGSEAESPWTPTCTRVMERFNRAVLKHTGSGPVSLHLSYDLTAVGGDKDLPRGGVSKRERDALHRAWNRAGWTVRWTDDQKDHQVHLLAYPVEAEASHEPGTEPWLVHSPMWGARGLVDSALRLFDLDAVSRGGCRELLRDLLAKNRHVTARFYPWHELQWGDDDEILTGE